MGQGFSSAPAWRIVLSYFSLFYAVQRGAMGYVTFLQDDADLTGLALIYGLQVVSALAVFVALRWHARWIVPSILLAGGLLGSTALVGWGMGLLPPVSAATQLLFAVLGTAAFAALVRLGLRDDEQKIRPSR